MAALAIWVQPKRSANDQRALWKTFDKDHADKRRSELNCARLSIWQISSILLIDFHHHDLFPLTLAFDWRFFNFTFFAISVLKIGEFRERCPKS